MTTLKKNDIENYEDALLALIEAGKDLPPRPPSEWDGEMKAAEFWNISGLPNAEKAYRLIRDVFVTKEALATTLGCHTDLVDRLLAGQLPEDICDWEGGFDSPGDRFWCVFICHRMLLELNNCNVFRLTPAGAERLGVTREQFPEFQEVLARALRTPSGWTGDVYAVLGEMFCLIENDYPPEPPADVPE